GDQAIEHRPASRTLEVERDAFLVSVDAEKVGAFTVDEGRTPGSRVVTFAWLLDFDDAGAHIAQHHRAVRAGQHARQVENGNTVEWRHRSSPLLYSDCYEIPSRHRR